MGWLWGANKPKSHCDGHQQDSLPTITTGPHGRWENQSYRLPHPSIQRRKEVHACGDRQAGGNWLAREAPDKRGRHVTPWVAVGHKTRRNFGGSRTPHPGPSPAPHNASRRTSAASAPRLLSHILYSMRRRWQGLDGRRHVGVVVLACFPTKSAPQQTHHLEPLVWSHLRCENPNPAQHNPPAREPPGPWYSTDHQTLT
jgi:hypothetical protein